MIKKSFIPEVWSSHTKEVIDNMLVVEYSIEPPHTPNNFLTRWYHNHRCTDCYIWREKVEFVVRVIKHD